MRCVESFLTREFATGVLGALDAKFRYVPVIMPHGMRDQYPARSKLRKKQRIYDCAPQLDYDVFSRGTFEAGLQEYLRGIADAAPRLVGLGATPEQIKVFKDTLAGAADRILIEQPDQTRY
jgi:hypothetical protein